MAIVRIPIPQASDEQLRDFCEIQQVDVSSAKGRADLMALLGPIWEHDYIPIQQAAPLDEDSVQAQQTVSPEAEAQQLVGGLGDKDPIVYCKINNTEGPGGKDPVPVGVNGRTVVLQRNLPINLPYRFYLALLDAIRGEAVTDENTGRIMDTIPVENYPVSVIRQPPQSEIDAWHARTDGELMPA